MDHHRSDPSYFGATAPYLDQEAQHDSSTNTPLPATMNALFPVGAASTETGTSTAATRPSRPISHSHAVTPHVPVHRPHQAPVAAADESTEPSLALKLQQIGFWNILIVVVATVVTLIVVAVVVSSRSDTTKSLSTDSSNRSPTLAPIPIRPRFSPTRAPVSARPVWVSSDTAQIHPSTIFPGSDDGCSYGDALAGSSAGYGAQHILFHESGLSFTVNGEAVSEGPLNGDYFLSIANVTLQIRTVYQFAVVHRTTPFVAALIRVSQGSGGNFTFGPWVENPYDMDADSQLGNECNTNVWGITDLGKGTTPSVTGRFVSESVGRGFEWDLVQVDVVVVLTNTTTGGVSYTYNQYFLNCTLDPVTETQPVEVGNPAAPSEPDVESIKPTVPMPTLIPTSTPPPSYATKCHVCGNPDWVISLPDEIVVISSEVTSCDVMAQRSALSLVPSEECAEAISQVVEHCGCQRAQFNETATPNAPTSGPKEQESLAPTTPQPVFSWFVAGAPGEGEQFGAFKVYLSGDTDPPTVPVISLSQLESSNVTFLIRYESTSATWLPNRVNFVYDNGAIVTSISGIDIPQVEGGYASFLGLTATIRGREFVYFEPSVGRHILEATIFREPSVVGAVRSLSFDVVV